MTLTATQPTCDARATGRVVTDWGFESLPCNTARGLRSLVDRDGTVRWFCAAPEHHQNVVRRYGVRDEPCYFCHRPLIDFTWTRVSFAGWGVASVCDDCSEKGRQDYDDPDRDEYDPNPEGDPTLNGAFG